MQGMPDLSEEATGLRKRVEAAGPREREKGWASVQRGKERKKEARGRRRRRLGLGCTGPVSLFSILLVQAPMHFIHFFQFFNPYKINKNNIKIAN